MVFSNGKVIKLSSNKGNIKEIGVVKIEKKTLVVKINKMAFVMHKVPVEPEDKIFIKPSSTTYMSATIDDVSFRWNLKKRISPNKTEKQNELASKLVEGGYFEFFKNEKYKVEILDVTEKDKSILAMKKNEAKVWNIYNVNDSELVLVRGNSGEKWYFTK